MKSAEKSYFRMEAKILKKYLDDIFYHISISMGVVISLGLLSASVFTTGEEKCETHPKDLNHEWYNETQYAKDVHFNLIDKTRLGDTKFFNTKLAGKNVLEVPILPNVSDALHKYFKTYVEPYLDNKKCQGPLKGVPGHEFFCTSPKGWHSDIMWVSVDSISSYNYLIPYFESMRLRDIFQSIIDVDQKIIVYSIFFVIRSRIPTHKWHIDFVKTTNTNGFTLLTPLQKKNNIRLAYEDVNGNIQYYKYKKDVGIVFGENFEHATDKTKKIRNKEVIFCFSFGTDKMRDWPKLQVSVTNQGNHYMHPIDGFRQRW